MRAAVVVVCALAVSAGAEPRTLAYAELLGKGGPWGVGIERQITPRLGLGAVGSVAIVAGGQQLYTAAPYVHATIAKRGRHAAFGEVGAVLVHTRVPSPVTGWSGMTDTGGGGIATLGWEHGGPRVVVRAYAAVEAGEGGVAPWLGALVGVRL